MAITGNLHNLLSRENLPYLPLAAYGAATGYIKHAPSAEKAWMCLIGAVSLYDITCPKGETLSEGVDRALDKHRIITTTAIGITALHLLNVLPDKLDPFKQVTELIKR